MFPGGKGGGREVDHSLPSATKVKNEHLPICLPDATVKCSMPFNIFVQCVYTWAYVQAFILWNREQAADEQKLN